MNVELKSSFRLFSLFFLSLLLNETYSLVIIVQNGSLPSKKYFKSVFTCCSGFLKVWLIDVYSAVLPVVWQKIFDFDFKNCFWILLFMLRIFFLSPSLTVWFKSFICLISLWVLWMSFYCCVSFQFLHFAYFPDLLRLVWMFKTVGKCSKNIFSVLKRSGSWEKYEIKEWIGSIRFF